MTLSIGTSILCLCLSIVGDVFTICFAKPALGTDR